MRRRARNRYRYLLYLVIIIIAIGVFTPMVEYVHKYITSAMMTEDEKRWLEYEEHLKQMANEDTFDAIIASSDACLANYLAYILFEYPHEYSRYLQEFPDFYVNLSIINDKGEEVDNPLKNNPSVTKKDIIMHIMDKYVNVGIKIEDTREVIKIEMEHSSFCGSAGCDGYDIAYINGELKSIGENKKSSWLEKNTEILRNKIKSSKMYALEVIPFNKANGMECM